jgi:hypothetical protein
MSEQRCTLLAPQYKAAASSCFAVRREQLTSAGVEQAQQNFLQCIAQIPDPNFQACARGEQTGPSCNCGTDKPTAPPVVSNPNSARFRKRN